MKLSELQGALPMEVHYAPDNLNGDITGVYCSDLLSNVMGQAKPGMLWVTMQAHPNIVAVASLLGLAGIVLTGGAQPEPDTIAKAAKEEMPLFSVPVSCFEAAGRLYEKGLRG